MICFFRFGYQLPARGRWISLNLKRPKKKAPKKAKKKQAIIEPRHNQYEKDDENDDDEMEIDEEEIKSIPLHGAKVLDQVVPTEDDDPDDPQKTVPRARYNAMMAVQKNTVYMYESFPTTSRYLIIDWFFLISYGGILESDSREYTLDDFYSLNLEKLDRFNCMRECDIRELEWKESDSEDGDEGEDDENDDTSSSSSEENENEKVEDESSKTRDDEMEVEVEVKPEEKVRSRELGQSI
jgi:hypothetical protein